MKAAFPDSGLYAITGGTRWKGEALVHATIRAISGGARVIQYRDKQHESITVARKLMQICRQTNTPLIINDNVALARECGADGVHLGRDDQSVAEARRILGADAIIGVSCYNSLETAQAARDQGVDYVAFGRFFKSRSKPGAAAANPEILSRFEPGIPKVAIGGITPSNGAGLLDAGADLLAVIDGVFGQPDPGIAAKAYADLFGDPVRRTV